VLTIRRSTRQIVVAVLSRNTDLTLNSIQRNIESSEKLEPTQFAQIWVVISNNFEKPKDFLQNISKNKSLTNTILENNKSFDILFIQKLPWLVICQLPSFLSEEEEDLIEVLHYLSWITFTKLSFINNNYSKIITYVNNKLVKLLFSLRKNIFNYQDINLISFFNYSTMFFILNIYLDNQ